MSHKKLLGAQRYQDDLCDPIQNQNISATDHSEAEENNGHNEVFDENAQRMFPDDDEVQVIPADNSVIQRLTTPSGAVGVGNNTEVGTTSRSVTPKTNQSARISGGILPAQRWLTQNFPMLSTSTTTPTVNSSSASPATQGVMQVSRAQLQSIVERGESIHSHEVVSRASGIGSVALNTWPIYSTSLPTAIIPAPASSVMSLTPMNNGFGTVTLTSGHQRQQQPPYIISTGHLQGVAPIHGPIRLQRVHDPAQQPASILSSNSSQINYQAAQGLKRPLSPPRVTLPDTGTSVYNIADSSVLSTQLQLTPRQEFIPQNIHIPGDAKPVRDSLGNWRFYPRCANVQGVADVGQLVFRPFVYTHLKKIVIGKVESHGRNSYFMRLDPQNDLLYLLTEIIAKYKEFSLLPKQPLRQKLLELASSLID